MPRDVMALSCTFAGIFTKVSSQLDELRKHTEQISKYCLIIIIMNSNNHEMSKHKTIKASDIIMLFNFK